MRGITLISTSSLQNSHIYTLSGSSPSPSLSFSPSQKCTLQLAQSSEEFCIWFAGAVEKLAGVSYSNSIRPRLKRQRRRILLSFLSALPKAPDRAINPFPHHSFPSITPWCSLLFFFIFKICTGGRCASVCVYDVFISWWEPNIAIRIGMFVSFDLVGTFGRSLQRRQLLCSKTN